MYRTKKSVNKVAVSRTMSMSTSHSSGLILNDKTNLRADEIYLIALGFEITPCEALKWGEVQLVGN